MKKLSPFHILLVLIFVMGLLFLPAWLMPEDGVSLFGWKVRFLTTENMLHPREQQSADITDILQEVDTAMIDINDPIQRKPVKHTFDGKTTTGKPSGGTNKLESSTIIHFSDEGKKNLYAFFEKLDAAAQPGKKIHILHYGDSQIEGDRMTAFIRQRIQAHFGGHGPGLIPAMNVYSTMTFKQNWSPNFIRYACFGGDNQLKTRKYGVMGSAARFTPEMNDSLLSSEFTEKEGWIEFEPNRGAYERARAYNQVKLYYTSCLKPCSIKVFKAGELIHEDSLVSDGKFHVFKLSFPDTPGKLKYVFKSTVSPTICGFALEGDLGVQVDNIAMRGSSGTIFGSLEGNTASAMYKDLNAQLVIMQFGGNSVPFFKDSASVRNFASYFKRQIGIVKKYNPGAVVVVIGPSDMSRMVDGIYETYPFLPYCVQMMRKYTLEAGAGYWDLFNAMGGLNSMNSWVDKGLAGKDYIHFSPKGASIASQLFYDAFSAEYGKWKQGVN